MRWLLVLFELLRLPDDWVLSAHYATIDLLLIVALKGALGRVGAAMHDDKVLPIPLRWAPRFDHLVCFNRRIGQSVLDLGRDWAILI